MPESPEPTGTARLDVELVRRGLARSRAHAQDLLGAGTVRVDGIPRARAADRVAATADVAVTTAEPVWVSRAAAKLLGALEAFAPAGSTVTGRRCLDLGASTGGFTQVLLAHGAAQVVAVDVGHDQLVESLRTDPRVSVVEGCNVRDATPDALGGRGELVVADLSFISLRLVLPAIAALVADDGDVVVLVKPQFEVGRSRIGRGGIVRDPGDREAALRGVLAAAEGAGLGVHGLAHSPIRGTGGNVEYLGWLSLRPAGRLGAERIEEQVARMCRAEVDGPRR